MAADTEGRVHKVLRDHFELTLMTDDNTDPTIEQLGGDSMDAIEVVMALEEEFHIEIADQWEVNGDTRTSALVATVTAILADPNAMPTREVVGHAV